MRTRPLDLLKRLESRCPVCRIIIAKLRRHLPLSEEDRMHLVMEVRTLQGIKHNGHGMKNRRPGARW